MADKAQVQLLLQELGQRVGISNLALDDDGRCDLTIDDELEIGITYADGDTHLALAALIGTMPADASREQYAMLLDANFFWRGTNGATLGVDRETRAVVLVESLSLNGLYVGQLERVLGAFVDSAQDWMDQLSGRAPAQSDTGGLDDHPAGLGHVILPV